MEPKGLLAGDGLKGRGGVGPWPHQAGEEGDGPADQPFQRRDPGFILLKKIRRGRVFVKDAGLVLLNPDPDQVSTDVVALGEPMQGLAGQEKRSDLASYSMLCVRCLAMGFHPSKARLDGQFLLVRNRPAQGAHSTAEIIRLVVMMYVIFPLSLRNVGDLLAERGVDISHETVGFRGVMVRGGG